MRRRIVAIGMSLIFISSLVVVIDSSIQIAEGSPIIYVDDEPGEGPDNPLENYISIQDAIDNATAGDTIFVYNGTYYENVGIYKAINLYGESKENTIIHGGGNGDTVRITSDGVDLQGFNIIRGGSQILEDAGLELFEVNNCKVLNNNISLNHMFGIKMEGSNYNNISNNVLFSNVMRGISIEGSSENTFYNNFFNKNEFGMYLDWANYNNIIKNNISKNDYGIICQGSDDNFFTDNILRYNDKLGFFLADSNEATLINNTMVKDGILIYGFWSVGYTITHTIDTSNTVDGKPVHYLKNQKGGTVPSGAGQVILANCKNVTVENQELTNGDDGIELVYSSNNIIKKNNVLSHDMRGILLIKSHNNLIVDNNASKNLEGICIIESNQNTINNNTVLQNIYRGISLEESDSNNISSNLISNHDFHGLELRLSSHNNISSNKITMSNSSEICLNQIADYNIIRNNTLYSSRGLGIDIKSSDYNHIYHNNIIANSHNQAWDDGDNNLWDNGYPSGGNYWSGYNGVDYFNGPGQNISGSDGIGDTPYVDILGYSCSQDNYPFKTTLRNYLFLYEGWNLISIPFIQSDINLGTILASISGSYDAVQWYNTTDSQDHWKHNHTKKPSHLIDLYNIDHKIGFWIHIIEPGGVLFEYFGIKPAVNQTIKLNSGWNLVGYPSLANHNRSIGLNNIEFGRDINLIQGYDAKTKTWHNLGSKDCFIRGRGYWVHALAKVIWEVPI